MEELQAKVLLMKDRNIDRLSALQTRYSLPCDDGAWTLDGEEGGYSPSKSRETETVETKLRDIHQLTRRFTPTNHITLSELEEDSEIVLQGGEGSGGGVTKVLVNTPR